MNQRAFAWNEKAVHPMILLPCLPLEVPFASTAPLVFSPALCQPGFT
jgi:hypothetical protein